MPSPEPPSHVLQFAGAKWGLNPSYDDCDWHYRLGLSTLDLSENSDHFVVNLSVVETVQLDASGDTWQEALANLETKLEALRGILQFGFGGP